MSRKEKAPATEAKPKSRPWPRDEAKRSEEILKRYQEGERDFRWLCFTDLRLQGVVLRDADFSGCKLSGTFADADLRAARFTGARLRKVTFSGARLERACFNSARLFAVHLDRADLTDARFVHANLSGDVTLAGARMTGVTFQEANLTGLSFPDCEWPRMSFHRALHGYGRQRPGEGLKLPLGYTYEREAMLLVGPGINLSRMDLQDFQFRGLDLSGANFAKADLQGALFVDVVLKGANFQGANLEGASFEDLPDGALQDADFTGARGVSSPGG